MDNQWIIRMLATHATEIQRWNGFDPKKTRVGPLKKKNVVFNWGDRTEVYSAVHIYILVLIDVNSLI